jgi:hypothetical protein
MPTGPDAVAAPAPTYTLFGVVTSRGAPVAGARVVVGRPGAAGLGAASTVTDPNGYYSLSNVRPEPRFDGAIGILVSKAGYFMEFKGTILSKDPQLDVALEPWVQIPLDAVIRGRVGETVCEGSGPCERFVFLPPSFGTLELTAPAFPFDLEVVGPNGLSAGSFYPRAGSSPPLQLRVPVDAGVSYEIWVISANGPTRDFVLTTALR